MKKNVMILLSAALLVFLAAVAGAGELIESADGIEGAYILTLDADHPAAEHLPLLAAQHGGQLERVYTHALNGGLVTGLSQAAARGLANHPAVLLVEQDGVVTINATQSGATWGIDRIDQRALPLDGNYTYNYDGAGVEVYIIDTGIRPTHNDFGGRATADFDSIGDGQNGIDCNGHGTHVAGTAAGSTWGVAKGAGIHGVRVLNCSGSGTFSGVVAGVDFVTQEKQNNPNTPMVANMSLGGGFSSSLNDAVDNSVQTGVFYAVAAGNNNGDACNYSPASAPLAYTVGSTTSSDSRSSFSNYGTCVDIFGPGSSITSAWYTGDNATATISGTSMASPHVAGVAALVLDEFPSLSATQVAAEVTSRATCNVVGNPGSGSPNLLLYSLSDTDPNCGAPPPPPPPPPACLAKGDACSSDADCCSNKCRGKSGAQTCK